LEIERPKRALRVLTHAKEVCEQNVKADPGPQGLLDILNSELEKLQNERAQKKNGLT
jgi:hypothetical protein